MERLIGAGPIEHYLLWSEVRTGAGPIEHWIDERTGAGPNEHIPIRAVPVQNVYISTIENCSATDDDILSQYCAEAIEHLKGAGPIEQILFLSDDRSGAGPMEHSLYWSDERIGAGPIEQTLHWSDERTGAGPNEHIHIRAVPVQNVYISTIEFLFGASERGWTH